MQASPQEGAAPVAPPSLALEDKEVRMISAALRSIAKGMFVVYAAVVLTAIPPIQLRNPGWIQGLINVIITNGAIPLAGLALVLLAAMVPPVSRRTLGLARLLARLAVPAGLGFLLLIPLQLGVAYRVVNQRNTTVAERVRTANEQLDTLRRRVSAAGSADQLRAAATGLSPALQPVLSRPFPQSRNDLLRGIDNARAALRTNVPAETGRFNLALTKDLVRNVLLCLGLGLAFLAAGKLRLLGAYLPTLP